MIGNLLCNSRRLRRVAGVVALAVALAAGYAGGLQAADPKLDLAHDALTKARALLAAADSGVVSDKAAREFEKHVQRAIRFLDDAMEEIDSAKDVVDNP